ncbi:MAG: hypothetical protein AMJ81_02235 [Phycisphaerae bacterium SM23_33]|nr:MAG: hypothetical protein AMJ81_02235 [Phycisphaerae bacterium SM23_33]
MRMVVMITRRASGEYRASCPALPGCVVSGPSPEEAERRMVQAVRGYLANLDVPPPRKLALHAHVF